MLGLFCLFLHENIPIHSMALNFWGLEFFYAFIFSLNLVLILWNVVFLAAVTMPHVSKKSKAIKQRYEVIRSVDASIDGLVLTQADVDYFTELGITLDGESFHYVANALNQKLQLFLDSLEQS